MAPFSMSQTFGAWPKNKPLPEGYVPPYSPGDIVPWHFLPGLIVASFFASLTGTLLTVELLHRKRLGNSLISRVELFACAISMGLIGVWCMHFIGNRAIVLGHGESDQQLIYSPGWTFLSCILPVLGLAIAFYIAELGIKSFIFRRLLDIVSGVLAGLSIVGMHYVGNLGALNYTLAYPARYIVAACIIAVGDCIIALALFFYFKEKWIGVFWKRLLCAFLLAIAVCGMHYTASIGCTYRLRVDGLSTSSGRNIAVIVAGTLCGIAAISVLIVLAYTNYRKKILKDRAQLVMLACAYFDEQGNIMVTNEGVLPSQMIAKRFALQVHESSGLFDKKDSLTIFQKFDDEFGVHHPVFQWIWRVSHDWESVVDLVPKMRAHLRRHDPYVGGKISSSSSTTSVYDPESYKNSTVLFRESYCVAAADLAERLHGTLNNLGALYDQVIGTGLMTNRQNKAMGDLEAASIASSGIFERGQLLFFTRKLRADEADHFTAAGFRFAPFSRVEAVIARITQIPLVLLKMQIDRLHTFAEQKSSRPPPKEGVYLVCLAALARVRSSFLVLAKKSSQDELPDVQLTPNKLTPFQLDYLRTFNGWTAERIVRMIEWKDKYRKTLPSEEKHFVVLLRNALAVLAESMGEDWFFELQFSSQPIKTPYGTSKVKEVSETTIFGFTRLLDIHTGTLRLPDGLALVSWDYFKLRQFYFPGCNDHGRMRHEVHAEFGPLVTKHADSRHSDEVRRGNFPDALGGRHSLLSRHFPRLHRTTNKEDIVQSDTCSAKGLVDAAHEQQQMPETPNTPTRPWGGILATTDMVVVETSQCSSQMEMKSFGPHVTATALTHVKEPRSYVDVLYSQAKTHNAAIQKTAP